MMDGTLSVWVDFTLSIGCLSQIRTATLIVYIRISRQHNGDSDISSSSFWPDTTRITVPKCNSEDTVYTRLAILEYHRISLCDFPDDAYYPVKPRDKPATCAAKPHLLIYMEQSNLHINPRTLLSYIITRAIYSTYLSLANRSIPISTRTYAHSTHPSQCTFLSEANFWKLTPTFGPLDIDVSSRVQAKG